MPGSLIREVSGIEATEPVDMGAEPPCRNPPAISTEYIDLCCPNLG